MKEPSLCERIRGYYLGKKDDINYNDPMIIYYVNRSKDKKSLKLSDVAKYEVEISDEEFESLGLRRR